MLCPSTMIAESSEIKVPTTTSRAKLVANATTPPLWQDSWVKHIPLIGKVIWCAMNASRYETTLEQNADFIAEDLETYESRWSGKTVGIIDRSKGIQQTATNELTQAMSQVRLKDGEIKELKGKNSKLQQEIRNL